MAVEPSIKRTVAFIDGQNLFHAAKHAYGYSYPNYDPLALSRAVCADRSWLLRSTSFYSGIPAAEDNQDWNYFWAKKLGVLGSRGVHIFTRLLKYRPQAIRLANGQAGIAQVGQEKGIDVRIALDVVRMARECAYDVALIFSQDQDLSEVADEVRRIASEQKRWIKVASAFPVGPEYANKRGINGTDWIRLNKHMYDSCLDPNDYRLPPKT